MEISGRSLSPEKLVGCVPAGVAVIHNAVVKVLHAVAVRIRPAERLQHHMVQHRPAVRVRRTERGLGLEERGCNRPAVRQVQRPKLVLVRGLRAGAGGQQCRDDLILLVGVQRGPLVSLPGVDRRAGLAVGEAVILLHPPLHLVGISIGMEKESVSKNDSLADGYARRNQCPHRRTVRSEVQRGGLGVRPGLRVCPDREKRFDHRSGAGRVQRLVPA